MAISDSTIVVSASDVRAAPLSEADAREMLDLIHRNADEWWRLVLAFIDGEGWKALKYKSWSACVAAEFNVSNSRAYHLFNAAKVNKALTDGGIAPIKEGPARSFSPIANNPEAVREVHQEVQERTGGKATAKDYDAAVKSRQSADLARLQKKSTSARPASFQNDRREQVEMYRCGTCDERVPDGHDCSSQSVCIGCPVHCGQ